MNSIGASTPSLRARPRRSDSSRAGRANGMPCAKRRYSAKARRFGPQSFIGRAQGRILRLQRGDTLLQLGKLRQQRRFYAAAVERDPSLFEDAASQRVIIVTPATLIALAKAVAFGWRQEKVAENAQRVHALGRELYRRMITMTSHIEHCGDALGKSVKHFNQFIGSIEYSVMPQARRFNELEVEGTAMEIPVLKPIELEPRMLRTDRDFAEKELLSADTPVCPSTATALSALVAEGPSMTTLPAAQPLNSD
jgi:hypothetical protein